MKILVLSDSHRRKLDLNLKGYDLVIHCGDYGESYNYLKANNIIFVRGNCDLLGDKEKILTFINKRILIIHGDLYNVKYDLLAITYKGLSVHCNICFYGHTHIQNYFFSDSILYLNPGSYQNDEYVVIDNNKILFYSNKKIIKAIDYDWEWLNDFKWGARAW